MPVQRSSRRSSSSSSSAGNRRGASTVAGPPAVQRQTSAVPAQQQAPSSGGGFMSNVASIATGSVIGHGVSSMLFGRSHDAAPPAEGVPQAPQDQTFQQRTAGGTCEIQAKDFTQCLNATNNDMSACAYYLESLKACQSMAAQY